MTLISENQIEIIQQLMGQVADLKERVSFLESELARIRDNSVVEVVELREISREQAKEEIIELFGTTEGPIYFSDIEDQLGIEWELVVEICKELLDEGAIGLDDDTV